MMTFLYVFRYRGAGNVGMSVMEVGILTGFVPLQESFDKVCLTPVRQSFRVYSLM